MSGADGIAFTDAELDVIRRVYTEHGGDGHVALPILRDLLPHRTGDTIRGRARRMKLVRPRYFMPAGRAVASPPMEVEVRRVVYSSKPQRCRHCGAGQAALFVDEDGGWACVNCGERHPRDGR